MSSDPNAPVETHPEAEQPKTPEIPPYETDEFKKKVIAAGFPGSPQTDPAFLAALHRFSGEGEPAQPPSEPAPQQS
jgi:hypothetical protein